MRKSKDQVWFRLLILFQAERHNREQEDHLSPKPTVNDSPVVDTNINGTADDIQHASSQSQVSNDSNSTNRRG